MNWDQCQKRANDFLAEGICLLQSQSCCSANEILLKCCGNYLISVDGHPQYIDEAEDLKARLRQQFRATLSTFCKNYRRLGYEAEIHTFSVQVMKTNIGRKEIEEFGISNIPCSLNRFQLGKRARQVSASSVELWKTVQENTVALLETGSQKVMTASYARGDKASPPTHPGIYLVRTQGTDRLLYVGESSDLAERWHKAHCRSTYFSALRRHIATEVLGFSLKVRNGKAKYLEASEEKAVSEFLDLTQCAFVPVAIGRYELEEYLINKYAPTLNRKGNSNYVG